MIIQPSGDPFPLEGGRAGMGVSAGDVWKPIGGGASSALRFSRGAHTSSQPSPFEGEGSGRGLLRQVSPSPAAPIRLQALEEEA